MNLIMYNIADLSLKYRFKSYMIEVHCVLKLERLPIREFQRTDVSNAVQVIKFNVVRDRVTT